MKSQQTGFVSFLVVVLIMMVLSLIVLAFARLVRREQTQTLDRQLNSQAFYAAESGVNDARNKLASNPGLSLTDYDECNEFIDVPPALDARLDGAAGNVSYSCLLVDPSPSQLDYSSVPTDQSIALPLFPQNATPPINPPITRLDISWEDSAGATTLAGCPTGSNTDTPDAFPGQWDPNCEIGMLRVEIVPFDGSKTRDQLISERFIAYLQPRRTTGLTSMNFNEASGISALTGSNPRGQGEIIGVRCNNAGIRRCTLSLSGVPSITNGFMRLRSIYRTTAVTITAYNGSSPVGLAGVQATIDATGKANDVLKRIKVNVPLAQGNEPFPEFALQSTSSQCKRIYLTPPATFAIGWPGGTADNDECNPLQTQNSVSP